MLKKIAIAAVLVAAPLMAGAANVSLDLVSQAGTGTPVSFNVSGNASNASLARISVINAQAGDVALLQAMHNGSWTNLSLSSEQEAVANVSSTNFRITFNNPKHYVIGYTLENDGSVIASTAMPINITASAAAQVLGATKYNFTRNLSYGMRGEDVKALQNILIENGFLKNQVTGLFARATLQAVKEYQASKGIRTTGTVGPLTRAELSK